MAVLSGLKPERVFYYFEEICNIPHPSYEEKAISDYLVGFAKEHNLEYYQDDLDNVIMIKEASKGYEDVEPIILQGHMDMVAEQTANCKKDMSKEGLDLAIDGDWIYAKETTLGGDDGIAVAYSLALLDDETLKHPRLEVIITVSEETGMDGAKGIDVSPLKGHTLLNLDSEEEGYLLTGCAGGCRMDLHLPLDRQNVDGTVSIIKIDGLLGGHSGAEIDKGRVNADHLLARLLKEMSDSFDFDVVSMNGGTKDNAIPSRCEAKIVYSIDTKEIEAFLKDRQNLYRKENSGRDEGVIITIEETSENSARAMTKDSAKKAIAFIMAIPNGIQAMCAHVPGLVETSLNLGIMITDDNEISMKYALRSSLASSMDALRDKVAVISEAFGASWESNEPYPAWEFREDSPLREKMIKIYEEMFGKKPEVILMHAGLECGLLSEKIKDLDCVSIGPDMKDIHTPQEKLCISSTERMYNYVRKIIETK